MRRAVLIYNPLSGRQRAARLLPAVLRGLSAGGFEVEPRATAAAGEATRLAREAAAGGDIEVAFAMGGDGTLREVAAGLLGSDVALGPLAAGTTNVVALALGLPRSATAAAQAMGDCVPRAIDVGLCGGEPFLMLASAGLDAAVMALQHSEWKRRLGRGAFAYAALRQWWSYSYPPIQVRVGERRERVSFFAACNLPYYGGRFRLAPGADPYDGLLDLVLFRGSGRTATLALARDLALGRHLGRADVERVQVERLEILAPAELGIEIDGDVVTPAAPVEIRLASERLQVLAP